MRLLFASLVFAFVIMAQGAPVTPTAAVERRQGGVIGPPGPILRQFIHPKVDEDEYDV
ncbi:hypothetical protein GSI_14632 [Ganoderma sinense ZZ0214-1]|uniref:Transporter n=1 Tax=Ganoderma sinense ZZ0214-1 TaxID=1077348 RepID=A0A2G8RP99_9APHY|nr:hypothetical protein GSI_14632 [Ganoderma sinense ZZ0214-1]